MDDNLLVEICRTHQLLGTNIPEILIESNLLLEQSFGQLVRGVEKILDRNAIDYAERVLPISAERNIEKRIETFIEQRLTTAAGKTEIRNFIKGMAQSSPDFAEKFINTNKSTLDSLAAVRGNDVAERVIRASFGDEVLEAWKKSNVVTRPQRTRPITTPSQIPSELKDSNGVKKFQNWLNNNYPTWNGGKQVSITGKSYGTFGPNTKKAWETYSKEYERFLVKESVGNVGINTEKEISNFQEWMKDTGRWSDDTYELNKEKGLSEDTKKAWEANKESYKQSLGYKINLEVAGKKILAGEIKPKKGGWWDSKLSYLHPATRKTIFNSIRKSLWFYGVSLNVLVKDSQSQIDDIMSKLLTAIENQKVDFRSSRDLYRDISIQIAALRKSADQRYDLFLKEIEKTLINSGQDYAVSTSVINELKTYSAFEKMFEKPGTPNPVWIDEIWQESSVKAALSGLTEGWTPFWTQLFKKLRNVVERTIMFLSTGNIRKASEITDFMLKNGMKQGFKNYVLVCYGMKFLIVPAIFSTFSFLKNCALNIYNPENGVWASDWEELWRDSNYFAPLYEKVITGDISVLLPWSWYWDNLDDFGDSVAQQKIGSGMRKKLNELEKKLDVTRQKADSLQQVIFDQTKVMKEQAEEIIRIGKDDTTNIPSPSVTYTNDKNGLLDWLNANGLNVGGVSGKYKGGFLDGDKEDMTQNGNTFTYKGSDVNNKNIYTFTFKDGNFTQESVRPINEIFKKNNMKTILNKNEIERILSMHQVLKEQSNPIYRDNKLKKGLYVEQGRTSTTTDLPAWTKDYPCLSDYGALQKTTDDNIIVHNTNNGKVKHYFYKNKNFLYKNTEDNNQFKGNWECVNGKLLIKTPIDNQQWNKEKGWHDIPENNSNTDTTTNTGSALPSWVTSNPCLSRLTLSGTPNNQNKVYEIVGGGRGEVWYYSKNGTFERKDSDNNTLKGTWKCKSNDKLRVITPSNNRQWNEDTDKWTFYRGYTTCPDSLPLKQWCKNNTIKTVQACLRMPSNLQTGNFGPKTEEFLISNNQNGKTITIDTVKNVCGANHPLVTSLAGAGGSTTGGSGSGGSGTTGGSTTGGSTTGGTVVTKTGYEDFVRDEIEIPEE
jgi:hypothetical protein